MCVQGLTHEKIGNPFDSLDVLRFPPYPSVLSVSRQKGISDVESLIATTLLMLSISKQKEFSDVESLTALTVHHQAIS